MPRYSLEEVIAQARAAEATFRNASPESIRDLDGILHDLERVKYEANNARKANIERLIPTLKGIRDRMRAELAPIAPPAHVRPTTLGKMEHLGNGQVRITINGMISEMSRQMARQIHPEFFANVGPGPAPAPAPAPPVRRVYVPPAPAPPVRRVYVPPAPVPAPPAPVPAPPAPVPAPPAPVLFGAYVPPAPVRRLRRGRDACAMENGRVPRANEGVNNEVHCMRNCTRSFQKLAETLTEYVSPPRGYVRIPEEVINQLERCLAVRRLDMNEWAANPRGNRGIAEGHQREINRLQNLLDDVRRIGVNNIRAITWNEEYNNFAIIRNPNRGGKATRKQTKSKKRKTRSK